MSKILGVCKNRADSDLFTDIPCLKNLIIFLISSASCFSLADNEKVKVKAATGFRNTVVYWYLDNNFIGKTDKNHELELEFENGEHRLYIIDNFGNSTTVTFKTDKKEIK